jgi:glycosyltransferase involved in cell wall biosynthesis
MTTVKGTDPVPAAADGAPALAGGLRVALVHDWLTGMRGGEKALEVLCELVPHAELFTLVHVPGSVSPRIERMRRHTSIIQRLPGSGRYYRQYLPLFPFAIEQFDLDGFDLIVSSSHCAAKAVVKPGQSRHLCYCHTPMRYAWDQFEAYFGPAVVGPAASAFLRPVMRHLARWDARTADRVDRFIANSRYVAQRISRYYNRVSSVVYPPVDTTFYHPDGSSAGDSLLIVSALVPYKRIDVAIDAAKTAGVPLRIVGQGPELDKLKRQAGSSVEFLGSCSNEEIRDLYRQAAAVLLPGAEDFGIVPVEAQACGRPVVAYALGGATESIEDGVTGILVEGDTAADFADGITRARATEFDAARIRRRAVRFSRDRFAREMTRTIQEFIDAPAEAVRW